MASIAPRMANGFAYQGCRFMKPETKPPNSVPTAPMPTPSAATMPTILPTSTGPLACGTMPESAAALRRASFSRSFASANFCTCSSIRRRNFL